MKIGKFEINEWYQRKFVSTRNKWFRSCKDGNTNIVSMQLIIGENHYRVYFYGPLEFLNNIEHTDVFDRNRNIEDVKNEIDKFLTKISKLMAFV
jgi:hypothetical protein